MKIEIFQDYTLEVLKWRAAYKLLTEEIRNTKRTRNSNFKMGLPAWKEQYSITSLKQEATEALAYREQIKQEGIRLWNEAAKEKAAS